MLDGSDLAILIPLWHRTENIERVHASISDTVPAARAVFVFSAGDQQVVDTLMTSPERYERMTLCVDGKGGERGDYAHKINAGYRATREPFLFTGADDLVFHEGWYEAARSRFQSETERGANILNAVQSIGVVGTNDLANPRTFNGEHSTHSLVARWYADCCAVFDQDHAIYHEGYGHEYCDDELVGYAKYQGAYAHAADAIVEHMHPIADKAPDDATYQAGRRWTRRSRRRFLERSRQWRALRRI